MIKRYSRPEMAAIWSDENKFRTWLKVEVLACEAMADVGEIPTQAVETIKQKADFDIARVLEIEETVKHDVIAFLTNVAEYVGPDSRYIHLGMTSSDLLDTTLAVQMRQAGKMLLKSMEALKAAIAERAIEFKDTPCMGRSHGIHAEPTTFGLKLAIWYEEVKRGILRLKHAVDTVSVGQISGAVGTFAHINPLLEGFVCAKLGLKPAPVSTQVIQRDRHAEFLSALALIASSLEKFSTEIRNLQRTEILEVEESFTKGQKGSSAMPHKRNPVTCEQITGIARVVRSNVVPALENVALWHERDITHSSVERIIIPDSTIGLDYILHKMTGIVRNFTVYPENMMRNIELTNGLVYSQGLLLALARKGITREEAYAIVQRNAMAVWEKGGDFQSHIAKDKDIKKHLTDRQVKDCFDLTKNLRNVDYIFTRVGLLDKKIKVKSKKKRGRVE